MRLLLPLFLLPCLAHADLQADLDACIALGANYIKLSGRIRVDKTIEVRDPANPENVRLCIEGDGSPTQIDAYVDGPVFRFYNGKYCTFSKVRMVNHLGSGWEMLADPFTKDGVTSPGSSSSNSWYDCRVQCKGTGWLFKASGGSDISVTSLYSCQVQGCDKGVKVSGSNGLDLMFFNFTGDTLGVGADLSDGGSDSKWFGGGFSYAATGWLVNPGYQIVVDGPTMEATGIVVDFGSGTGSGSSLSFSDVRNCGTLLRSGQNGASTRLTVSALKVTPKTKIQLTGDSKAGILTLNGAAALLPVSGASAFGVVKKVGIQFSATGGG